MDFGFSKLFEDDDLISQLSGSSSSASGASSAMPYMGVVSSVLSSLPSFASLFESETSPSALTSDGQTLASYQQRVSQQKTQQGIGSAIGIILSILSVVLAA